MTPDLLDLARAVVALPGWRWVAGMRAIPQPGMIAVPVRLCDDKRIGYPDEHDWPHDIGLRLPDLTDAATGGCCIDLLGDARACIYPLYHGFYWRLDNSQSLGDQPLALGVACARVAIARDGWWTPNE